MRKYDHLFFDLDNTLWDFDANSKLAMFETLKQSEVLRRLPSFEQFFEVYEPINQTLWDEYHAKRITKQALIVERFSQSFQYFGISGLNWAELNSLYLTSMAFQTRLFPGTIETLTSLRLKGYKMYIITNGFSEVQHDKLNNCGLDGFFSKVFISEEIQTTKPHRQIFEHALKSTNARKNKSIMIGDSWETDIVGAQNFGIDQIVFLNHGSNRLPVDIKSIRTTPTNSFLELSPRTKTWFIDELKDLIAIL
jgi:putative hydrolase of the HAD superfamily